MGMDSHCGRCRVADRRDRDVDEEEASGRSNSSAQFGPEYDRTIESADSKRKAESELAARQERREQLDIRPLSCAARERYTTQWQTVQAQFVDNPTGAVASADTLIQSVMADRGYPVDDFESARGRRLRRPPARRRELPRGTPARGAERERRRLDGGSPPGDAALPRALRRARRAGRRRRRADDARAQDDTTTSTQTQQAPR